MIRRISFFIHGHHPSKKSYFVNEVEAGAPVCSDAGVRVLAYHPGRHGGGSLANAVTQAWGAGAAVAPAAAAATATTAGVNAREGLTHLKDSAAGNYDSSSVVVGNSSNQAFHGSVSSSSMRLADVLHILTTTPEFLVLAGVVVVADVDRELRCGLACPAAVGAAKCQAAADSVCLAGVVAQQAVVLDKNKSQLVVVYLNTTGTPHIERRRQSSFVPRRGSVRGDRPRCPRPESPNTSTGLCCGRAKGFNCSADVGCIIKSSFASSKPTAAEEKVD